MGERETRDASGTTGRNERRSGRPERLLDPGLGWGPLARSSHSVARAPDATVLAASRCWRRYGARGVTMLAAPPKCSTEFRPRLAPTNSTGPLSWHKRGFARVAGRPGTTLYEPTRRRGGLPVLNLDTPQPTRPERARDTRRPMGRVRRRPSSWKHETWKHETRGGSLSHHGLGHGVEGRPVVIHRPDEVRS